MMLRQHSGRYGFGDTPLPPSNRDLPVHEGVVCDGCCHPIKGIRYRCSTCPDFDFCSFCMDDHDDVKNQHPDDHTFLRISKPTDAAAKPAILGDKSAWIHKNIPCRECKTLSIVGFRYFCVCCAISFCAHCEQGSLSHTISTTSHNSSHHLMKMGNPADYTVPPQETKHPISVGLEGSSDDKNSLGKYGITFDVLKRMLEREEVLRLSQETRAKFLEQGETAYVSIITDIQKQVGPEFGLSVEDGMTVLQCAESLVGDDVEKLNIVKEISHYRRHNRCADGPLNVLDAAPSLPGPLHCVDTTLTEISLDHYLGLSRNRPVVLLAGSYS